MGISTLAGKIQLCYSTTELAQVETGLTMTSREIAALTGKEHFHVKRDIQQMLNDLQLDESSFGCTYFDGQNRKQTEYLLNEELTLTLVSGYSVQLRNLIVKQWIEFRSLIRTQQLLIEKQAQEKAAAISEKLKIAEEAENLAERRVAAAKDLMVVFKPGQLTKKVKDDPYWKQLCIETLEAFLKDPKLSTHYANEHDNAVKECVNVQDKLNDVLRYVKTFMTVKPNGIASRFPDCTEVLAYRRNLLR